MTTSATISAASRVNRLTTFSTEKIHSLGDNDNTRPIRRSDRVLKERGWNAISKCQCVTRVPEGAKGDGAVHLSYMMKYECLWDISWKFFAWQVKETIIVNLTCWDEWSGYITVVQICSSYSKCFALLTLVHTFLSVPLFSMLIARNICLSPRYMAQAIQTCSVYKWPWHSIIIFLYPAFCLYDIVKSYTVNYHSHFSQLTSTLFLAPYMTD